MDERPAAMDEASSREWNQWLHQSIDARLSEVITKRKLEQLVDIIAEETRDFVHCEVDKLRAEIGELRADLNVTRALLDGKIVELKGSKNAA